VTTPRTSNGWGGRRKGAGAKPISDVERTRRAEERREQRKLARDMLAAAKTAAKEAPPGERKAATQMNFAAIQAIMEASDQSAQARPRTPEWCPFVIDPRKMPAGQAVPKKFTMAMDQSLVQSNQWMIDGWLAGGMIGARESEGLLWLGYPILSELAQRPEYRVISETIATEMTRKWIRFKGTSTNKPRDDRTPGNFEDKGASPGQEPEPGEPPQEAPEDVESQAVGEEQEERQAGDDAAADPPHRQEQADPDDDDTQAFRARIGGRHKIREMNGQGEGESEEEDDEGEEHDDKTEKIKELTDFLEDLKIRDRFATIALHDGLFGRAHLFLDLGANLDDMRGELATPIGNGRDEISKGKLSKGCLKALRVVEPTWAYPTTYNADNPMRHDWYHPQVWYVMGKEVHCSRLLTFIGRPVPDMLKPAYSFGGLALTQMAKPYVDIWLNTRESVGRLIHSFSVMVLMSDLSTILQPGTGAHITARVALFNKLRDNAGTFLINKNTEDFKNVSAPLGGLHELQAQAQEHMASVARIPLVKFTGIQPSGLNASSEGEIRTFYDTIAAYQNAFFRPNLNVVIDIAQVALWGAVDPDITWDFVPLWSMTEKEEAELKKLEAETGQILVDTGIVSQEEERRRIAADPTSPYPGLDPEDVPELLEEEMAGLEIPHAKEGELQEGGGPMIPGAAKPGRKMTNIGAAMRQQGNGERGGGDAVLPFRRGPRR